MTALAPSGMPGWLSIYSAKDNAVLAAAAFLRDIASWSINWKAVREADPDEISTRVRGSSGFLGT